MEGGWKVGGGGRWVEGVEVGWWMVDGRPWKAMECFCRRGGGCACVHGAEGEVRAEEGGRWAWRGGGGGGRARRTLPWCGCGTRADSTHSPSTRLHSCGEGWRRRAEMRCGRRRAEMFEHAGERRGRAGRRMRRRSGVRERAKRGREEQRGTEAQEAKRRTGEESLPGAALRSLSVRIAVGCSVLDFEGRVRAELRLRSEALRSTQKHAEARRTTQKHSAALRSTQKHSKHSRAL